MPPTSNLGYDLTNGIEPEISMARGDTATLANDLASLSAVGLPAPAGASATIAAARQTINETIGEANADIAQVATAYAIGNNMATSPPLPL